MTKSKRSKQSMKNRSRHHRALRKAARRLKTRSRAATAVSRSRRRDRMAKKSRKVFRSAR